LAPDTITSQGAQYEILPAFSTSVGAIDERRRLDQSRCFPDYKVSARVWHLPGEMDQDIGEFLSVAVTFAGRLKACMQVM
jgi:hypothetical protein